MMTFTVAEAYSIHEAMGNYIAAGKTIKGKIGLAFSYNFRLIHDAMGEYIARRQEIINKYADVITDDMKAEYEKAGKVPPVTVSDPENLKKANEEILAFEDLKVEIPIMQITVEDILNCADDIDSTDMSMVIWMTKEYESDKKKIKKD